MSIEHRIEFILKNKTHESTSVGWWGIRLLGQHDHVDEPVCKSVPVVEPEDQLDGCQLAFELYRHPPRCNEVGRWRWRMVLFSTLINIQEQNVKGRIVRFVLYGTKGSRGTVAERFQRLRLSLLLKTLALRIPIGRSRVQIPGSAPLK